MYVDDIYQTQASILTSGLTNIIVSARSNKHVIVLNFIHLGKCAGKSLIIKIFENLKDLDFS